MPTRHRSLGLLLAALLALGAAGPAFTQTPAPIELGSRLELMVDRHLIAEMKNVRLKAGTPRREEMSLPFDRPWEGRFAGASTVLRDGDVFRMYYRGSGYGADGAEDRLAELTCYAESRDGIHWTKPDLGLHEFRGSRANNIILPPGDKRRVSHNFMAFLDARPGVPADERYKAIGGTHEAGLIRLLSADGIRWREMAAPPLFAGYALDTLNVAMWAPAENQYVMYIRTWTEGGTPDQPKFRGLRTVSRAVSPDFVTWSTPEPMNYGDSPPEHIYTNGTQPYFRAPHLYVALPFRYVDGLAGSVTDHQKPAKTGRAALTKAEMDAWNFNLPWMRVGVSDVVLMTSRGGNRYDRTFMESFIRPGLERESWTSRGNGPAAGVVQTGPTEMSLYLQAHYMLPSYHMRRYSLRLDGFASVNAPFAGGEMLTHPLRFAGGKLVLNYSTSSVGGIRVEILGADGRPLPGFGLADCDEIIGDEIARSVSWKGSADVSRLAGQTVRLRFVLKDSDLYSLQFQP
ncbi:MAG: hypothetical protein JNG83_15070 [Opitutaceae bacterium]|nr:hypothetical protein [Opitutaceae bacterium]